MHLYNYDYATNTQEKRAHDIMYSQYSAFFTNTASIHLGIQILSVSTCEVRPDLYFLSIKFYRSKMQEHSHKTCKRF